MAAARFFRQRPYRGGRIPRPSCVIPSIEIELERLSKRHRVSKSFIVASILQKAFGMTDEAYEDFHTVAQQRAAEEREKQRAEKYKGAA